MTAHTRPGAAQRRHPRTAHRRTEGLRAIAPHDVTAEPGSTRTAAEAQRTYHHDLFGALWDRKTAARAIDGSGLRGLDQLGHFGADGCDLVVEAVAEHAPAGPLSVVELGCGLGGALRHVLTALSGRAEVARAVGVDVVEEHVRLTAESHAADPLSTPVTAVCAAAEDTGLPGGSFDVVFASGSLSHFTDVAAVVHEAYRLLRPGGLLTFTEEVSLVADPAALAEDFRAAHPDTVFRRATADKRAAQLAAAGFTAVSVRELGEWAADVLRTRWLSMRVNREKLVAVYGERQQKAVLETIATALSEIRRGTVMPALVAARRGPLDRG